MIGESWCRLLVLIRVLWYNKTVNSVLYTKCVKQSLLSRAMRQYLDRVLSVK